MDTSTSNYEKNCRDWQSRFLTMDQERLLALIPGLAREGGDLTLRHFGEKFAVDAATGAILPAATSCSMCRRIIINAGLEKVVIRTSPQDYVVVPVREWIEQDDSLPLRPGLEDNA